MLWFGKVHGMGIRRLGFAWVVAAMVLTGAVQPGWSYTSDTDWGNSDWTLSDGDTVAGVHTNVGHLFIPLGATVTVKDYDPDTGEFGKVAIFAESANIQGMLTASGAGYPALMGPGAGAGRNGGGYGGLGGAHNGGWGGERYGSVRKPFDMGSGGADETRGGRGGGAIRLDVNGVLTFGGTISTDGDSPSHSWYGGGSGGSIWLTAGTLEGDGLVHADGGPNSSGSGGGGGRIAFHAANDQFTGRVRASGGAGSSNDGGNGTFNFMDRYTASDDVTIVDDIALSPATDWEFNSLTVDNGATMDIQSTTDIVARIEITQNVNIASGATLSANGMGFPHAQGPGAGVSRGGAGYGGRGTGADQGYGGAPYGSVREPDQLGSGGHGSTDGGGGRGGGVILMDIGGALNLNGTMSANGWNGHGGWAGGGSGGSIRITAGTIEGEGLVSADGGESRSSSGGGGGGRIAFHAANYQFSGDIRASGQMGNDNLAGHGTFNFADHYGAEDELVIRNDIALAPSNDWVFAGLTITDEAMLHVQSTTDTVSRIHITGDVLVASNAVLSADGTGFPLGLGPGHGTRREGGGYGGRGGWAENENNVGGAYGVTNMPVDLGSPGGAQGDSRNPMGGGAIIMTVDGALTVDGSISANGWSRTSGWVGGGSGGSIWIITEALLGSGDIEANGGDASWGAGGGGRIAIWHGPMHPYDRTRALDGESFDRLHIVETAPETFAGNVRADGGFSDRTETAPGEDGTVRFVFVEPPTPGTLLMVR